MGCPLPVIGGHRAAHRTPSPFGGLRWLARYEIPWHVIFLTPTSPRLSRSARTSAICVIASFFVGLKQLPSLAGPVTGNHGWPAKADYPGFVIFAQKGHDRPSPSDFRECHSNIDQRSVCFVGWRPNPASLDTRPLLLDRHHVPVNLGVDLRCLRQQVAGSVCAKKRSTLCPVDKSPASQGVLYRRIGETARLPVAPGSCAISLLRCKWLP